MSTYKITKYSYNKAKELGVIIKPSSNKLKKIDVYKDNKKIATIGDIRYFDYPNYILKKGIEYANERRRLYKLRHKKDKNFKNGYYADKILW